MQTATKAENVVLRGGFSVPLAALQLLWNLENHGLTLAVDADGLLVVAPRSLLTDEDDRGIRSFRDQLVTLVRACQEEQ